ncbi:triphosphoribosyl-dephospho-CoA synthase [Hyphomicrobium sp. ghe19]|uniref:triphosphoribosyl-dephospho-CoA synthase n=1 Tax=Hyphomicrobium sp. ghe19 TaxID=2682968 RepID=UPI001366A507|nr:2-(5''-triphosphoribosyl)-3'-dephosphocoenzyme-A synthase [Hyphomicrobium sp. ghe19]
MSGPRQPAEITAAFLDACHAELNALKPGNVHRHSAGHGMEVFHFEQAAKAAAGPIADPALSVGKRILRATEASVAATGMNTNLGIVLLCAPLAKAASETTFDVGLRRRLGNILSALDVADADDAFEAIRIANPAGLGAVSEGDVRAEANRLTLIAAMHIAAERDRIANAYVNVFADVFDFALPALHAARAAPGADPALSITTLHMSLLAEVPDTHITRKYGLETALDVQREAHALKSSWFPVATAKSLSALLDFDAKLKQSRLNPGTTADFVVTTLFADALIERKHS